MQIVPARPGVSGYLAAYKQAPFSQDYEPISSPLGKASGASLETHDAFLATLPSVPAEARRMLGEALEPLIRYAIKV